MLTTAQQKVKQELEELQINALVHHHDETVILHKKYSIKKWFFTVTAIFLLIVTCSLFIRGHLTQKQSEIVSYLRNVDEYNEQSDNLLNEILTGNSANISHVKAQQQDLLSKVRNIETPSSFTKHQRDLITVMEHRIDMITYLSGPSNPTQNQVSKYVLELSVKQELAVDSLTNGLERENIKYSLGENGTVKFWIESKSYQLRK